MKPPGNEHQRDRKPSPRSGLVQPERCSEPEPAAQLRDKSNVSGGWLGSLTYVLDLVKAVKARAGRFFLIGCLLAGALLAVLWLGLSNEPSYGGKRLSVWLDELRVQQSSTHYPQDTTNQIRAIRVIGTNAIPWLLSELHRKGDPWTWRLNQILQKQSLIKYRFPDVNTRLSRVVTGFEALGELGAPAIPGLLSLLEAQPGYIPSALAGIGPPALPALQQCLTNTKTYQVSIGSFAPIPGNTIGALHNALNAGRISTADAAFLLPGIRAWAQSTNPNAALYATSYLKELDK